MKDTPFERTITNCIAQFIISIEKALEDGAMNTKVSIKEFIPAIELRDEIVIAIRKYSIKMLNSHGYED